jgi:uncharacterized protein
VARAEAFLGTGWSFPPSFDAGGSDVHMVSAETDIEQSLAILLATRQGERVMQDDFGCALQDFLFGAVDRGLLGRIRDLITQAIIYHEPRIQLNDVEIDAAEAGVLRISIDYTVRITNSRYNMVYPFYLEEAAIEPR